MSLISLRDNIEKMDETHQEEIMKILLENKVEMSNNSNGSFLNMSLLPKSVIEQLEKYSQYIEAQEKELDIIEDEKQQLKTTFFSNST